ARRPAEDVVRCLFIYDADLPLFCVERLDQQTAQVFREAERSNALHVTLSNLGGIASKKLRLPGDHLALHDRPMKRNIMPFKANRPGPSGCGISKDCKMVVFYFATGIVVFQCLEYILQSPNRFRRRVAARAERRAQDAL